MPSLDLNALASALAKLPGLPTDPALTALGTDSVSHHHFDIEDTDFLLRVPKSNRWDQSTGDQLAYEAAAFKQAEPSGHTPKLAALLPKSDEAPLGGLVVQRIAGRPADLLGKAGDLASIADALAALHAPMPTDQALPLHVQSDPVAETLAVIRRQAAYIGAAGLGEPSRRAFGEELAWVEMFAARDREGLKNRQGPIRLVGTDTHPGNFVIDDTGRAWFVDLEKLAYGSPAIDLAHASLPTSTGWDRHSAALLPTDAVASFYRHYLDKVGPEQAVALASWLKPMRRLTWLRTMSWYMRWRADWSRSPSAAVTDEGLRDHIEAYIDQCFEPDFIEATRAEWLDGPSPVPDPH
ncbi:MAG: phosphotransferase [Alphaproteobacteria bacterium]|nr:phosphotransferase [Alphaproteobacteria bacterium]